MKHIYMETTLAIIANSDKKNLDFVQSVLNGYERKALPLQDSEHVTQPSTYFVGEIEDDVE